MLKKLLFKIICIYSFILISAAAYANCDLGLLQFRPATSDLCATQSRICCADGSWSEWDGVCDGASSCNSKQCWNGKECENQTESCPQYGNYIQAECSVGKGWQYYCRCPKGNVVIFGKNDEKPICPRGEIQRVSSGRRYEIYGSDSYVPTFNSLSQSTRDSLMKHCKADFESRTKNQKRCKESALDCNGDNGINWNCAITDDNGNIKMLKDIHIELTYGTTTCSYGYCKTPTKGWCNYLYEVASCNWY